MNISYNGLWKHLIDKELQRKGLIENINVSFSTLAKMSKGEPVSLIALGGMREYLHCDIDDVMSFQETIKDEKRG